MAVLVKILAAGLDQAVGEIALPRVQPYGTWCHCVSSKSPILALKGCR